MPATLPTIPLFAKGGSIVPVGETMQYVDERTADNLELRVYPGADAEFALYEDEGDGYNYEHGVCSIIPMKWDDSTRRLTIGKREGSYPGMLQERTFRVTLPGQTVAKTITYKGKACTVKL